MTMANFRSKCSWGHGDGYDGELLDGGDDDSLPLGDELLEVGAGFGVSHGGANLGELLHGFRLLLAYVTFTSLEWASRGPLQINSCWVAGAGEALPRRRGILVLATNSNRNSTFQTSRPLPDAGL